MYDWPEVRNETEAFWDRVRTTVPRLPALSHPAESDDLLALWQDPATVVADCCWGAVDAGLCGTQQRLAQRSYHGVPGGTGSRYRSAVVAIGGNTAEPGDDAVLPDRIGSRRWAANSPDSRSGWLSIAEDAGLPDDGVLWTGSHRASIRAVAAGRADLAAIDCRSWQLALDHEPAARELTVVGWTAPRLGTFFMTGTETRPDVAAALREALSALGQFPLEDALDDA